MPTLCHICPNPKVKQIHQALVAGEGLRHTARRYGITSSSLFRHKKNCIPTLLKRLESKQMRQSKSLGEQLDGLEAVTTEILENAKQNGDGELALKAIDRRHKQVELHAKLAGEFKQDAPNPLTIEEKANRFNELIAKAETKLIGEAIQVETTQ